MVYLGRRKRIPYGMSLLEVVLALGILLMSLAALAQLISAGSRAAIDSQMQTEAIIRCQSKVAEVVCGSVPLQTVERASFADDPLWQWSLRIQATSIEDLLDVQVTVSRGGSGSHASSATYSLRRYLRDPETFVRERIKEQDFRSRQQLLIETTKQPPNDPGGEDADQ